MAGRRFDPAAEKREVTFIGPGVNLEIRFMYPTTNAICDAARTLKATHFITIDGWSVVVDKPQWGVFEMRTAQKDTPVRGEWSVNDPIKTFETDTADAAVMYALAIAGRG